MMMLETDHHVRIHGNEAAIAVIGETAIARESGQRLDRAVVEAEIEHCIHHAGHRGPRAGAHRDQKRIARIAERLAGQLADIIQRLLDLRLQLFRIGLLVVVEVIADRRRQREARRDRQTEIGHLGQVRALAAEQFAHRAFALGAAVTEGEHPLARLHRSGARGGLPGRRRQPRFRDRLDGRLRQRLAGRGGLFRRSLCSSGFGTGPGNGFRRGFGHGVRDG